jgi:hypothetical protein
MQPYNWPQTTPRIGDARGQTLQKAFPPHSECEPTNLNGLGVTAACRCVKVQSMTLHRVLKTLVLARRACSFRPPTGIKNISAVGTIGRKCCGSRRKARMNILMQRQATQAAISDIRRIWICARYQPAAGQGPLEEEFVSALSVRQVGF